MRRTAVVVALLLLAACTRTVTPSAPPSPSPTADASRFSMVVLGDFGSGDDQQRAVAARVRAHVEREGADAFVTTGDNIYPDGDPRDFERAWREPYGWVFEQGLTMIASLGNHDVLTNTQAVMDLLSMPARFYAASVGDADVFVLDGNNPNETQAAWLIGQLRDSTAAWKIAVFHQPPYSCAHHDGTPTVVRHWVPVFEQYGIDLVLNGHDHAYQRFRGDADVTYVVTGGGGKGLYRTDACPAGHPERVAANDRLHHFVAIDGTATTLRIRAIAVDGTTIDDVTLTR